MPELKPPARVVAIAAKIGDEPIAWSPDRADGSVTIVFCNKGKMTFQAEQIFEPEVFEVVIHTNEEAQEAVKTLAPTHKPSPKKKEK
jgi:hypothetical protein